MITILCLVSFCVLALAVTVTILWLRVEEPVSEFPQMYSGEVMYDVAKKSFEVQQTLKRTQEYNFQNGIRDILQGRSESDWLEPYQKDFNNELRN